MKLDRWTQFNLSREDQQFFDAFASPDSESSIVKDDTEIILSSHGTSFVVRVTSLPSIRICFSLNVPSLISGP